LARTVINVSNRLPITIEEHQVKRSSGGLVAALEGLAGQQYTTKWIGWPGAAFSDDSQRREVERILAEDHGCVPVFLSEEEVAAYYEGFANSSIWPLLHYLTSYLRYESSWWDHYQNVNRAFAEKVLEIAREHDLVWVHDYQLMLLPALLKAASPNLRVGFFLHTPFPAYEVFRCHPRRSELIAGMLGADLIGFHTFGYLRHFCGSVQRLLGVEAELTRIYTDDHRTALGVYPIGINATRFEKTLDSPEFRRRREQFRVAHEGRRLVVSVERMDYTKGILHRLEAIDHFLADLPSINEIRFIFVSVPSREGIEEYQALREEVETRVGRLNGKYATVRNSPIHFIHGSIPFTDLCALYSLADVAIVTPLIDGMNLVAKEYVACQRENAGSLILSEFAGAAEELFNAFLVNPYDARSVADTLSAALALPAREKQIRNDQMRERVIKHDARHWARSFINDLTSVTGSDSLVPKDDIAEVRQQIASALSDGKRVAFFLDYDGTLRELEREAPEAKPTAAVQSLFQQLAAQSNLDVAIISGRSEDDLQAWFGAYPFRLIAEHGASVRSPNGQEWERLDRTVNYAWKEELLPILRLFQEATPGSAIEVKRSSLVWHYRKANPEFGAWKARQLADELAAVTANKPIQVRHGKTIVEVSAGQISKGAAVAQVLQADAPYALVLCAGDDQTDEAMFELNAPHLVSIKVGSGSTRARYRIKEPAAFRRFLTDVLSSTP
jgi:trehalose 6-phosphate synthase/phosphatase